MQVYDFSCSYMTFSIDLQEKLPTTMSQKPPFTSNTIRIQLDCHCTVTDNAGNSTEYVLGAPCKSEQVNVSKNIWHQPNADYCVITSKDQFLLIKSWDMHDKGIRLYPPSRGIQPERQFGKVEDAWSRISIDLHRTTGRALPSNDHIIEATLAGHRLLGKTDFQTEDGLQIRLEYPVKTINIGEQDRFYQADTGPVLFPDLPPNGKGPIGRMRLAYVAHNRHDWAEFIINVPTAITDDIKVNHYSKSQGVNAVNTLYETQ